MKLYMRIVGILLLVFSAGMIVFLAQELLSTGYYSGGLLVPPFEQDPTSRVVVPVFSVIALALFVDYAIDAIRFAGVKKRTGRFVANTVTMIILSTGFYVIAMIFGGTVELTIQSLALHYLLPILYLIGTIGHKAMKDVLLINPTAASGKSTVSLRTETTSKQTPASTGFSVSGKEGKKERLSQPLNKEPARPAVDDKFPPLSPVNTIPNIDVKGSETGGLEITPEITVKETEIFAAQTDILREQTEILSEQTELLTEQTETLSDFDDSSENEDRDNKIFG